MDDRLIEPDTDASPGRRAELLASITDLFGNAGAVVSPPTAALYSEIVLGVFGALTATEQVALADRIADLPNAPAAVLEFLATAPIEIAEPPLRRSMAFEEEHLARLAAALPHDRLCAIASRRWISEPVSDALLDREDRAVLRLLAHNPGARFSQHGLTVLVDEASQTLAMRQVDASPPGQSEERGLVLAFPVGSAAKPSRRTASTAAGPGAVILLPVPARPIQAEPSAPETSPVAAVIATVASGDRMLEVAGLLAAFAGLPVDMVRRMIAKSDTMPLAVLCKAAGVSVATFSSIAAIRGRRHGHAADTIETLVRAYEALDDEDVARTLRFLRARHGAVFLAKGPAMQNPAI